MVFVFAAVLFVANFAAWLSTIISVPGNWLMLLFSGLYLFLLPKEYQPSLTQSVVVIGAGLAVLGEIVEFVAGAAGAAKQGGSNRGMVYSILGAFAGSLIGAVVGLPIPLIGSVIAAVVGGALGAFVGAYMGEKDRLHEERMAIGRGALIGRLLGTVGKLAVGMIMLVILTVDSFVDLPQ